MLNPILALPKRHPLAKEIRDLYGAEGSQYLTDLLELAQEIGYFELTIKEVCNTCGLNKQKASRLFDDLKRIYEQSWMFLQGKLEESCNKVPNKLEESWKKVETFGVQNPHGSIQACAGEVVVVNNINKTTTTTGDDQVGIVQLGYEYILSSGNTNLQNFGWVQGFLTTRFQEASVSHPNLSQTDLLSVWKITCDSAASKGASSANWYLKAWNGELNRYKKNTNYPKLVGPTRLERLMASTYIINRWDKKVLKVADLRLDHHNQLWDGYEQLEITEFDPYQEEALA